MDDDGVYPLRSEVFIFTPAAKHMCKNYYVDDWVIRALLRKNTTHLDKNLDFSFDPKSAS